MLGLADRGRIRRLLETVLSGDAAASLEQLDEAHELVGRGHAERLLPMVATSLLAALALTAALMESRGFAGIARPAGVAVGALLAWRRMPFVVVVVAAAATAALLRLAGVE